MKIGLLSDTHSYLDPKVFDYFKDMDEIWHGGDIGLSSVMDQLTAFKPVRAVHGNIDDRATQIKYPEDLHFKVEGVTVWITHIGGTPPKYNPRVLNLLRTKAPDVFVCGHSHMLLIKRDPNFNNMLFINPGAAGNHGFHTMKTLVRFEINRSRIEKMEVIEIGKRGALPAGTQNL